ncbi:hypothetical protein DPSP01_014450 [Paraphaeosphaeria sporulosa]
MRSTNPGILRLLAVVYSLGGKALAQVELGTATPYGIIAATAITNTGDTTIDGLLGIFPNDRTSITGFPPGLSGGINAANAAANSARDDAATAYGVAASLTSTGSTGPDLGNQVLTPGVYTAASSVGITGLLTLNAQNDPNAVFVFQIGSTMTTATASSVILINGAQTCNVFWQVGSSATLGTATVFAGNVLALTSITVNAGVTVDGSLYAWNGAVTLINDRITAQTSCVVVTPSSSVVSPSSPVVSSSDAAKSETGIVTDAPTDVPTDSSTDAPTDTPIPSPSVSPALTLSPPLLPFLSPSLAPSPSLPGVFSPSPLPLLSSSIFPVISPTPSLTPSLTFSSTITFYTLTTIIDVLTMTLDVLTSIDTFTFDTHPNTRRLNNAGRFNTPRNLDNPLPILFDTLFNTISDNAIDNNDLSNNFLHALPYANINVHTGLLRRHFHAYAHHIPHQHLDIQIPLSLPVSLTVSLEAEAEAVEPESAV